MTKTKQHTPGPWEITDAYDMRPNGEAIVYSIHGNPGRIVAETLAHDDEDEANARLIAAAPDLLEAAKHALAWMDDTYGKFHPESEAGKAASMLCAAIRRAEGGSE